MGGILIISYLISLIYSILGVAAAFDRILSAGDYSMTIMTSIQNLSLSTGDRCYASLAEMSVHSSPPVPRVGVGIVIHRGDELLLVCRRQDRDEGIWSSPGGYLEYGESPVDCAEREAFEETGAIVSGVRFLAMTHDFSPERGEHLITLWMIADAMTGERAIHSPMEDVEVRWFPLDELPQPRLPGFENLLKTNLLNSLCIPDRVRVICDYSIAATTDRSP